MGEHHLQTTAVIPVKRLDSAHGRLVGVVEEPDRRRLAESMFQDTLAKIPRCRTISKTLIVTADEAVARHSRWLGHEVLMQDEDHGHSEAASDGVRAAHAAGAERVVMLSTDCPLLDPAELDRHLGESLRTILIVPD